MGDSISSPKGMLAELKETRPVTTPAIHPSLNWKHRTAQLAANEHSAGKAQSRKYLLEAIKGEL